MCMAYRFLIVTALLLLTKMGLAQLPPFRYIQITVWNQTPAPIALLCQPLQANIHISPESPIILRPGDSPAIVLTIQNTGALLKCLTNQTDSSSFIYTVNQDFSEQVTIIPSIVPHQINFHYDSIYPGAFILY